MLNYDRVVVQILIINFKAIINNFHNRYECAFLLTILHVFLTQTNYVNFIVKLLYTIMNL